ncbi:MAG: transposase [Chloroflexi bacterium]|nr:transposase [Chloroflexota bacterium]
MPTDIPSLTYGTFFHIYNRGNNGENIFIQERNYAYFMELWWKHISPIAETWAYGLLRNHFHAAVWIKNKEDLTGLINDSVNPDLRADKGVIPSDSHGDLSGLKKKLKEPSQYFSNFFNAYSRSVNIAVQRTGALFERPFNRIPVDTESYLMRLIVYIHQNPQKHQFVTDFRDWNYSSYHDLVSNNPTRLQREKVLQLFGSCADFIRIHQEIQPLDLTGFIIESDD